MTLLLTGPAAIINALVAHNDNSSVWSLGLYLMIIAGYLLGGALAGRQHPSTAFVHGAAATVWAFAVLQTIGIIRRLVNGDSVPIGALAFNALLAASIGVIGAWFGARRGTLVSGGGEAGQVTAAHIRGSRKVGTPQDRVLAKPVEVTCRKVPQRTDRR